MTMALFLAVKTVLSRRTRALTSGFLVPSGSAAAGAAGAGSRQAVGIALQAVADAAATRTERTQGAVAVDKRLS